MLNELTEGNFDQIIGQEITIPDHIKHRKSGSTGIVIDLMFDVVTVEFPDEPGEFYDFEIDTLKQ